jgi:hypothetical protein
MRLQTAGYPDVRWLNDERGLNMSEAEAVELIAAYLDSLIVSISVYLSVTFAFLVVSHSVGSRLSRFQATVVSVLYVAAALITYGAMLISQLWIESLLESNPTVLRTENLKFMMNMGFWKIALAVLIFSGIFVSLYYSHDARRNAAAKD